MSLFNRLLLITFLESIATALVERGIFFYTNEKLGFTAFEQLLLALVFAVPYVFAALASHRICTRISERRLTVISIVAQSAVFIATAMHPVRLVMFLMYAVTGIVTGLKWPPIESYVSAGLTPSLTARRLGTFNVTWAVSVPIAIVITGPLIELWDRSIFVVPIGLSIVSLFLLRKVPSRPVHLAADHPERPNAVSMRRIGDLLVASRWLMLGNYALWYITGALLPSIFDELGYGLVSSTSLGCVLDAFRVVAFILLGRFIGWHFKVWPLVVVAVMLPLGFTLVLSGISADGNVLTVLIGEVIFGLAAGMVYYAALYYAMIVKNASVDAGGVHEGLIGIGLTIGPIAAMGGERVAFYTAITPFWGTLAGVAPIMIVCTGAAIPALWRQLSAAPAHAPPLPVNTGESRTPDPPSPP